MWVFAIAYVWIVLLWPYIVAAIAVGFWLLALRQRIDGKLAYALLAFIACMVACSAIEFMLGFVIPLDIAGTPPPDPRNVHLRFLITAAVQLPAALVLAYFVGRLFFNRSSRQRA
jgi:hypothetical protein